MTGRLVGYTGISPKAAFEEMNTWRISTKPNFLERDFWTARRDSFDWLNHAASMGLFRQPSRCVLGRRSVRCASRRSKSEIQA